MTRARILLDGQPFADFERLELVRDLEEIAGGVVVEGLDAARLAAAFPAWWRDVWRPGARRGPIRPGERLEVELDGEPALLGWLDVVSVSYSATKAGVRLEGRDVTGDLVDCAAAPRGPAEYRNVTLLELCRAICLPFGIAVRAELELPERFPRFGIDPGETALSAIEKACRQRAVLAVSDGLGALVLTRGGRTARAGALRFGEGIAGAEARFDHSQRFGEYLVKGQTQAATRGTPALLATAAPLTEAAPALRPAPSSPAGPRSRVVMSGRATDAAVTRYRPTVLMARTQSGGATAQQQADWAMRTARARAESLRYPVPGWRHGPDDALWRPNQRVLVEDPLSGVAHELLISAVRYLWSEQGAQAELTLSGVEAFDVLRDGEERERRARQPARAGAQVATAEPLTEGAPTPLPVRLNAGRTR